MTNELKTYRLIVTLPDTSGEEADVIAGYLETKLRLRLDRKVTVNHALGEFAGNGAVSVVNEFTVTDAHELAAKAHTGQVDKLGVPYVEHVEAVRSLVELMGGNQVEQIAALLHDVIEDTDLTKDDLRQAGVPEEAVFIVVALTHGPHEKRSRYIEQVVAHGLSAVMVKLADTMHNADPVRLAGLDVETRTRLIAKYRPALIRLSGAARTHGII